MNKQQFFTAGSLLLATTALTSAANAGTFVSIDQTSDNTTAIKAIKVSDTVFSATASTANSVVLGPINGNSGSTTNLALQFGSALGPSTKFNVYVQVTGATFVSSSEAGAVILEGSGTSITASVTAATLGCSAIQVNSTTMLLEGCNAALNAGSVTAAGGVGQVSASFIGVMFPGLEFANASGLAAAGASIALTATVTDAGGSNLTFDTTTSTNVVTSAAPFVATITPAGNAVASASATPVAFDYIASQGGVTTNAASMTLATIILTNTGSIVDNTLSTAVTPYTTVPSIQVTLTDSLLSSGAVSQVNVGGSAVVANLTAANFIGGVATFSIKAGLGNYSGLTISVQFNGTTAIPAAAAGTLNVSYGTLAANKQSLAAVTGATAAVSLGGFSGELNTFLSSTNTGYNSYIRIHNNGGLAGAVTIAVKNDATGVALGTYTTAVLASGETLQLSAAQIEAGATITAAAGLNYTLDVTGPISGYVQHIIFNPATGQLADFSAFRDGGAPIGGGVIIP